MEGWRAEDVSDFKRLPAARLDFLPKPFQASVLEQRVETLLKSESAATAGDGAE